MRQLSLLLIVYCVAHVSSTYADTSHEERFANLVCKTTSGSKSQLATLSSVTEVIGYLSRLPKGHKLDECRDKYLESLERLVQVLESNLGDVCGDEKLALLEDYHRRYISKISKHEKERKHKNKAPKLAKLFFMQYASEVSSICARVALESLANYEPQDDKLAKMEKLRKFTDNLGMTEFSKGYKGVYLFWNMVDALNLDKKAKYLSKEGDIRVNAQMKRAKGVAKLQAYCRYQLKPVYSRSLLPVLRLVDMGYYPEMNDLLETDGTVRNLLYATQICETILPVRVYLSENLNNNEAVALTRDEASQLTPYQSSNESVVSEPLKVVPSSLGPEELNFAETNCDEAKANVDYRGKIVSRMLKKMAKRLMNLKSLIKGFKLFRRNQNQKLEAIDDNEIEKITDESLQLYEKKESGLLREKRDLGITIAAIVIIVVVVVIVIIILICIALSGGSPGGYGPSPVVAFFR